MNFCITSLQKMTNEMSSETTTHVPLLKYEDQDSLVGFGGSREEGMADSDSLEGHIITVVQPSSDNYFVRIVKKPIFWLVVVILVLALVCVILGGLLSRSNKEYKTLVQKENSICLSQGCLDSAHYMIHAIDPSADPCEDFFQYSCGGWIKNNPIPDSEAFWGTFSSLWDSNMKVMKQLLTDEAIKNSSSSSIKLAKTFYDSCMNMDEINNRGAQPLHQIIKDAGGWSVSHNSTGKKNTFNFNKQLQKIHLKYKETVFFSFSVEPDAKNSSSNIIEIDQGGLPIERSYYLKNITDKTLVAYHTFMTTIRILLGGQKVVVEKDMKEVLEFEMKIAKIFVPPNNRSQIDQMYRKMTIKELSKICPKIQWLDFFQEAFKGVTIKDTENVVVMATDYLKALSPVINRASSKVLNNYMMWKIVSGSVSSLSRPFRDASHALHKVLDGISQPEELWKTCISETDDAVGMALGNLFVKEKFEGSSRNEALMMINGIRGAFKARLPLLDWMDAETRKAAIDKADSIINMIGYPDYILDLKKLDKKYEGLKFLPLEYFANLQASSEFFWAKNSKDLRKRVDKNKWLMTPQTVNAYYSPSRNQIVFPAGILQAPYYDKRYPKYCNYGSIGGAVGHELVHGFDNSGRMYDKNGNYGVQWWTNKSVEGFQVKADCLIKQYDQYSYYGKHEKGKFTLGENIADNGGLKAAYLAYQNWIKKNGEEKTLPVLGKTNEQLFFIAYGQSWCANIRPEKAREMVEVDPHSPNKFRVLGTLSNLKEFATAFNCPLGSNMNPQNKCVIW